jgi:hypothetical protein
MAYYKDIISNFCNDSNYEGGYSIVSARGGCLYSYAKVIAAYEGDTLLINTTDSSVTTNKHIGATVLLAYGKRIVDVPKVSAPGRSSMEDHKEVLRLYRVRYNSLIVQANKARSRRSELVNLADQVRSDVDRYCTLFKLAQSEELERVDLTNFESIYASVIAHRFDTT